MFSITLQMRCLDFLNNINGIDQLLSGLILIFLIKLQNHFSKVIIN